jgi:catechol-2,3-dioxygenase
MVADFDKPVGKVNSPLKLAHVVLRTNNFASMVEYYKTFLGAEVVYKNEFLAFLTYDEEHHRLAIVAVPGTKGKDAESCGLEHIAFSFRSLEDLLLTYRQRKQKGINPIWPVNHGPTTSIYYKDPDGNMIETQVDNFESPDEATDFMNSVYFAENPIGTDIDPEDIISKLRSGVSESELKKRIEIGPRGLPTLAQASVAQ